MNKSEILNMPYNKNSLKEIEKCLKENKTFVCSNAMGSGKSLLIEKLANKRRFKRVLIVVKDTRTTVAKMAHANNWDCVTYYKLVSKDTSVYDCVICDEAHHILSDGCKSKAKQLQKQKKLYLFTSTTQRTDRQDLVDLVDCEINYLTFGDAVIAGIYAKPTYIQSYLREADTPTYKVKAKLDGRSAYETLEKYIKNQNKIVVFETTNKQMENDYEILGKPLQDLGFKTRMFTSKHYDESTLEWFNTNNKVALFTCNLLNESHHIEGLDCEIILRHTSSLIVVNQQIGRVATFDTNRKIVILDLACNNKLITTFAEGSKLDKLGDYFKITDKEGNLKRSNIKDVLNVEFDTEQLDPWSSRLKIKYKNKEYVLTDFCKEYNVSYRSLFRKIKNGYSDFDIEKIIANPLGRSKACYFLDGKLIQRKSISKKLNIPMWVIIRFIEKNGIYISSKELIKFNSNYKGIRDKNKKLEEVRKLLGNDYKKYRGFCFRYNLKITSKTSISKYNKFRSDTNKNRVPYKGKYISYLDATEIAHISHYRMKEMIAKYKTLESVLDALYKFKVLGKLYKSKQEIADSYYLAASNMNNLKTSKDIEEYLEKSIYGKDSGRIIVDWKEYDSVYDFFILNKIEPIKFSKWCYESHIKNRLIPKILYQYLKEKHKLKNKGRKE